MHSGTAHGGPFEAQCIDYVPAGVDAREILDRYSLQLPRRNTYVIDYDRYVLLANGRVFLPRTGYVREYYPDKARTRVAVPDRRALKTLQQNPATRLYLRKPVAVSWAGGCVA